MLASAHIPTGTATNNEFDIDEVNSRHLKLAVAPNRCLGSVAGRVCGAGYRPPFVALMGYFVVLALAIVRH
jgi:hypothetical protein